MEATPICQAWLRTDGGKGIRNKVLVLYTVECSKHVAESIAAHFQAQHRDVDVTGSLACLDNQAVVQRMLAYCVHPNVGAVLIVGHGCEYIEPDRIRDFARAHGRPAEAFYLQKVGGTPTEGRRIAVLGGMLELGDFAPELHAGVGREAAKTADLLLAYGPCSECYVQGAHEAGLAGARAFATHDALVAALEETCRAGDTLLFKGSHGMHMEQVLARLLKTKEHMGE